MQTDNASDPRLDAAEDDAHLVVGYTQEAVDDFLLAVTREREALHEVIKEARVREARAQGVIGMHELMVAMMLETHRELGARRRDAEGRASEIVREGERHAEEILRAAYDGAGATAEFEDAVGRLPHRGDTTGRRALEEASWDDAYDPTGAGIDELVIDLRKDSGDVNGEVVEPAWVGAANAAMNHNGTAGNNEDFFAFLRGALHDDEPLGPRADGQEDTWRP